MIYLIPFLVVFGTYVFTLNPSVTLGDGGELVTAAYFLGIPHVPGYPLFTQIGKAFTFLPLGNVAFRLNLMSACFASLSFLVLCKFLSRFTRNSLVSLSIALTMAFLPVFWRQALMARVYPLHIFLISLTLYVILKFQKTSDRSWQFLTAFLIGLCLSGHQMSMGAILPFLLLILTTNGKALWGDIRGVSIFITFMIFGLSLYLHLPIRSALNPALDWWDPERWQTFYETLIQWEYHGKLFSDPMIIKLRIAWQVLGAFVGELSISLVLGILGVILLCSRFKEWRWALALLCLLISNMALGIYYLPEKESHLIFRYLLMSYLVICIFIGCGCAGVLNWAGQYMSRRYFTILSMLLFLIPLTTFSNSVFKNRQEENFIAYDHALNIFKTVPARAVLLTGGDNDLFPLWYLQEVEKWSAEMAAIGIGGLEMNWYLKRLRERYDKLYPNFFPETNKGNLPIKSNYPFPIYTLFTIIPDQKIIFLSAEDSLMPVGLVFQLRKASKKVTWEENKREWRKYSLRGIFDPLRQNDHQLKDILHRYAHFFNQLGLSGEKRGAVEETIKYYRMASILEDNWIYHYNLGLTLLKKKEVKKALEEFQVALRLAPRERNIQFAFATAYSLHAESDL